MARYTTKFTVENTMRMLFPSRKFLMRPWSPMRCRMSPVMRESKNCSGMAVSFMRKSAMSWMSMRECMCSIIHERM